MVMIMLHYFPRFQKKSQISNCIKMIIGNEPTTLLQFITNNKQNLKI